MRKIGIMMDALCYGFDAEWLLPDARSITFVSVLEYQFIDVFLEGCLVVIDGSLINLLKDVKRGDADAYVDLSLRYAPLIDSLLVKYLGSDNRSLEDFRQEAEIALYSAACAYDVDQSKVTFGLYAGICIRNRIVTVLRSEKNNPVIFSGQTFENGGFFFESDAFFAASEDPALAAVSAESYGEMIKGIGGCLTEYEKKVFALYLAGMNVGEISSEIGRERKSVENAICRIRSKIKKMISERESNN